MLIGAYRKGSPGFLIPKHVLQLLLDDIGGISGQIRNSIPVCCGTSPGSPSWTCPEYLHKEASRRQPDRM